MQFLRGISFCLLILYSYLLVRAFTPYAVLACNYEEVIQEYCIYNDILKEKCDGACYLHHSVKHHQDSENHSGPASIVKISPIPAHDLVENSIFLVGHEENQISFVQKNAELSDGLLDNPVPPPKG